MKGDFKAVCVFCREPLGEPYAQHAEALIELKTAAAKEGDLLYTLAFVK